MSATTRYSPQTLSAALLVAGVCIGGGMLAMPVVTSPAGFFPSLAVMVCCWLAMTLTGLYFVEVGFWMKKDDAHVISMSGQLLGLPGKAVSWLLYLFVAYASLVAYIAGSAHLITDACSQLGGARLSYAGGCLLFAVLFSPVLYVSHMTLGRLNSWFMYAMFVAYILLIWFGAHGVHTENLLRSNWRHCWIGLPFLLTSFSFQTIVPSLHPFLGHHGPSLRLAIIGGSSLAFLVYIVWQVTILGMIPFEGEAGLQQALKDGVPPTHFIGVHLGNHWVGIIGSIFAFFALVTSFFGISMGLYDFLADGLNIPKKGMGNLLLGALIIIPALIAAIGCERIFLLALDASGGFGDSLLNGIIPVLMVVLGRYYYKLGRQGVRVPGGKWLLGIAFLFYLTSLGIEILTHTGHLLPIFDVRDVEPEL